MGFHRPHTKRMDVDENSSHAGYGSMCIKGGCCICAILKVPKSQVLAHTVYLRDLIMFSEPSNSCLPIELSQCTGKPVFKCS